MKKVIRWEASDGSLHRHRADAAYRERQLRKAKVATARHFLFLCSSFCSSRCGRLPAGTWADDGTFFYIWSTTSVDAEVAIRRAVRRLQSLQLRTGMDWRLDEDMQVGADVALQYIGDHPLVRAAA